MTSKQKLVLDIINQSRSHPTASEVYEEAKCRCPGIVFATVYNSLNRLSSDGTIRRIIIHGSPERYDRVDNDRHDHLICTECGRIFDITIEGMEKYLRENAWENLISYDLSINFLCDHCTEKSMTNRGKNGNKK